MANPDDVPNRDEPTKSSLRETAAKKTRAVTSATTDVMRDGFDKVIDQSMTWRRDNSRRPPTKRTRWLPSGTQGRREGAEG